MEKLKYELPKINNLSYKILINALKFYKISNVEFALDGELFVQTYILLDYIDKHSTRTKYNKYKLPKFNCSSYEILISALRYYQISSIEFSNDKNKTSNIYKLIHYIEENTNILE